MSFQELLRKIMATYNVNVFQTLLSMYKTWPELEAYLTSFEGGQIRCVGEGRYRVLRYTKGVSDMKLPHVGWMRSVIWDTKEHLPVCVAPAKAEKGEVPLPGETSYPLVQTFLDGTMINVFRTVEEPLRLQIATRSQIGAGGKFYSDKTFEQMFDEALKAMNATREDLLYLLATPTEMVPYHFASLVLQHPEHRVVARCRVPHLWLVHAGAVHDSGMVSLNENVDHWPPRFKIPVVPVGDAFKTGESLTTFFAELCKENGWFYQGLVIKDGKGKRWRLRNPMYLYLRSLRGSEAAPLDRFLRLRSERKISEYLKHYSEDRDLFWGFEQKLRSVTDQIYLGYCEVHKSHEKKLEDLPWAVKPCVFKLHSLYLEQLRPSQQKVTKAHAVDLVNNLPLFEQKRLLTPPRHPSGLVAAAAALATAAVITP